MGGVRRRGEAPQWELIPRLFFLGAFALYFGAVVVRHGWFQTSSWDLGIFDQAVDLIGQGQPPFSSCLGFHILGDHGALVLYPLGWIDRLAPSVYTLLALQSAALIRGLVDRLRTDPQWSIRYQRDDVWLFDRRSPAASPTIVKSRQQ